VPITAGMAIDEEDLEWRFIRASGPGGQNVNKVSTAAQLRFNAAGSRALTDDVRARLLQLAGRRATANGTIVIDARRYRSQERNRQDALERLSTLIHRAMEKPRPRKATRPSKAAKQRRLEAKRRRSELKRTRGGGRGHFPDN